MLNTAIIFINPSSTHAFKTVEILIGYLSGINIVSKIATTEDHHSFFKQNIPNIELISFKDIPIEKSIAFAIGGDGTFLFAAKQITKLNIPIVGIHEGNRGFLAPFMPNDIKKLMNDIKNNNINIQEVPVWKTTISTTKQPIYFINEFILQRYTHNSMVKYDLAIENMGSFNGRSDGLIISSSTGSTAYNLTAGGSIIHNSLQVLSLTPICPHNLKHKTMVIPPSNITLTLQNDTACIAHDGFSDGEISKGETISISKTEYSIKCVQPISSKYLNYISEKIF